MPERRIEFSDFLREEGIPPHKMDIVGDHERGRIAATELVANAARHLRIEAPHLYSWLAQNERAVPIFARLLRRGLSPEEAATRALREMEPE